MRYFIGREGRQLGPYTEQQVRDQLAARLIGHDDVFWCEGMTDWQPVRTRFGAATPPPLSPPPLAPTRPFGAAPASSSAPRAPGLASREKRLLATSFDHVAAIVFSLPGLIGIGRALIGPLQSAMLNPEAAPDINRLSAQFTQIILSSLTLLIIPLSILAVIQLVLLARRGQTIGKLLCKIRIVRTNGEPAGFVHACLLRAVVMGVVVAIPFVGWAVSLADPLFIFREDHRCLHDLLAGTTVIDC